MFLASFATSENEGIPHDILLCLMFSKMFSSAFIFLETFLLKGNFSTLEPSKLNFPVSHSKKPWQDEMNHCKVAMALRHNLPMLHSAWCLIILFRLWSLPVHMYSLIALFRPKCWICHNAFIHAIKWGGAKLSHFLYFIKFLLFMSEQNIQIYSYLNVAWMCPRISAGGSKEKIRGYLEGTSLEEALRFSHYFSAISWGIHIPWIEVGEHSISLSVSK